MESKFQLGPLSGSATLAASRQNLKVGVLSDTHGWIDPHILDILADADCIVHAGDVLGVSVLQTLEGLTGKGTVVAVAGNNDVRGNGIETGSLPTVAEVSLPGGTLVVTHGDQFGIQTHAKLRQTWPGARAVVYGHTHRLVCDQEDVPWVLNPGAAGRTRIHEGPSCLMLTADQDGWVVEAHQFAL